MSKTRSGDLAGYTCAVELLATFIWLLVLTKKVALTPALARALSTRAVLVASGASSNVSATVCRVDSIAGQLTHCHIIL